MRNCIIAEDILQIDTLARGGSLTQAEITEAVGRRPNVVRAEMYTLVITNRLRRICGVGSGPAAYYLPQFEYRHTHPQRHLPTLRAEACR